MKVIPSENELENPFFDPSKRSKCRNSGKKELIALTKEQEDELLKVAYEQNPKHGLMIELALNTGLRVNELVNLIISDVILNGPSPEIYVHDRNVSKYSGPFLCKSLLSNRHIPLPLEKDSNLVVKLRASIGTRKTGYVFQSNVKKNRDFDNLTKTSMIDTLNDYAKKCKSIGRNIGFHTTRRTYASKLLDVNTPLPQIMLALGHSSLATTVKYLRSIRKLDMSLIRDGLKRYNEKDGDK